MVQGHAAASTSTAPPRGRLLQLHDLVRQPRSWSRTRTADARFSRQPAGHGPARHPLLRRRAAGARGRHSRRQPVRDRHEAAALHARRARGAPRPRHRRRSPSCACIRRTSARRRRPSSGRPRSLRSPRARPATAPSRKALPQKVWICGEDGRALYVNERMRACHGAEVLDPRRSPRAPGPPRRRALHRAAHRRHRHRASPSRGRSGCAATTAPIAGTS